jgi:eukaryotic-like serine/threonine-protein kinase
MINDFVLFLTKDQIMSLIQFFKSKQFFLHLSISFGVVIIGLILAFLGFNLYTRHGKSITVPPIKGLNEQQVSALLDKSHLRYTIIDSIHNPDLTPGVVVEQIPAEGSKVKKDRMLFITINAFSAEQVRMPALVDYSLRNAQVMLESFGLKAGRIIYIPSEYTNLVMGQKFNGRDIAAGASLPKGSEIDLIVGQGLSSEQTSVPDLIGLTLDEARQYLNSGTNLTIGAIICDETILTPSDSVMAIIYKQTPAPADGALIRQGSSLNVWLSTNMELILSGLPDSLLQTTGDNLETE